MPGYDRTGPEGKGAGTGRKQGPCYNKEFKEEDQQIRQGTPRRLNRMIGQGRGLGPCGRGLGRGRRL